MHLYSYFLLFFFSITYSLFFTLFISHMILYSLHIYLILSNATLISPISFSHYLSTLILLLIILINNIHSILINYIISQNSQTLYLLFNSHLYLYDIYFKLISYNTISLIYSSYYSH